MFVTVFYISTAGFSQEVLRSFEDEKDDVYSMPIDDFVDVVNESDPSSYSEILELMNELEDHENSTINETIDCIDIVEVRLEDGDPNATLSILMEGDIEDCYYTTIVTWTNCSPDGTPISFHMGDLNDINVNETFFHMEYGDEVITIQGNVEENEASFEFDADLISTEEVCCIYVIALSIDPATEEISWDSANDCDTEEECETSEDIEGDDSDGVGGLDFGSDELDELMLVSGVIFALFMLAIVAAVTVGNAVISKEGR